MTPEQRDCLEETIRSLTERLAALEAPRPRSGAPMEKLPRPPEGPDGLDLVVFVRRACSHCRGTGKVRNEKWDQFWRGCWGDPSERDLNWFRGEVGLGLVSCPDCEGWGYTAEEMPLARALAHLRPEEVDAERRQLGGDDYPYED